MNDMPDKPEKPETEPLIEGIDYYLENGLMVLTALFLKKRGYCCRNNCRHCPYTLKNEVKYKRS